MDTLRKGRLHGLGCSAAFPCPKHVTHGGANDLPKETDIGYQLGAWLNARPISTCKLSNDPMRLGLLGQLYPV